MSDSDARDPSTQVAIIGMAGRFPGARDAAQYWRNLRDGVESISFFTAEELAAAGVEEADLNNPAYVRAIGALEGIDMFDSSFFGINPREAEITDPQQRLFLECAWEALEDAAYDSARYDGAIGVFGGAGTCSYWMNIVSDHELMAAVNPMQVTFGNDKDFLATLVSYRMNLRGPSITVQTACSTSLVAVHLACQSLLNGECEMALAGGSRITARQIEGHYYREGGITSPDGRCRAFDVEANGIVGGNGVGVVVLKRLADALQDGDNIHAIIRGSAINNDGSNKVGYSAPSVRGQASAISEALAVARVRPEQISYIEAHGTGTRLGDPIEIAALTQAFRSGTDRKGFCAVGSVKPNIGHLDVAAGVAGLIKTVLALNHGLIPPSLNCKQPNPLLGLESSPFFINTKLTPWESNGTPRRAGVSSFGIGGTNAHVIVEEAPRAIATKSPRAVQLLVLSARSTDALDQASHRLRDHLKQHPSLPLPDVAYTLQVGRRAFRHRRCFLCADVAEAVEVLEAVDPRGVLSAEAGEARPQAVFMFSGQGTQRLYMGREFYEAETCFREWMDLCAGLLEAPLGLDLRKLLYPVPPRQQPAAIALQETWLAQPALFAVEYALAQWLIKCGIKPTAMIGHSLGEYVAACLAGVFTLEEGLRLVVERGRLMQQMPTGAMLAVQLEEDQLAAWLGPGLWLAAINGGEQCVVSGTLDAISTLERALEAEGISSKRLPTAHAFHSGLMDSMVKRFASVLKQVQLRQPRLPFVSNVTGEWIQPKEASDAAYWLQQLREPVRFGAGLRTLAQDRGRVLIEVGPGETLCRLAKRQIRDSVILQSLGAAKPEQQCRGEAARLYRTLGELWLSGVTVDWHGLYEHERRRRVSLPTYPFERERYWVERRRSGAAANRLAQQVTDASPTVPKREDVAHWFYAPVWKQTPLPWLGLSSEASDQGITWLIFTDGGAISRGVTDRLEEAGARVITVEIGEIFTDCGSGRYRIHPGRPADYVDLIRTLEARSQYPRRIAHLWSLQAGIEKAETPFSSAQELGFYSLIYLTRALGGRREAETPELRIAVVSGGIQEVTGEEELNDDQATVLGPCRGMSQEYPGLTCRNIDIVKPAQGSRAEARVVGSLVDELRSQSLEQIVAYRGGQRWVQMYDAVPLNVPAKISAAHTGKLRTGGVYLITGGLGRIGLELAACLCREAKAKVALVGRRRLSVQEQWEESLDQAEGGAVPVAEQLRQLENGEGELWIETADVADEERMIDVIRQVKARWGRLDGVIHGAGLNPRNSLRLIADVDPGDCDAQFRAKVWGTKVLERVLEGEDLDFCLLMSSVETVLGGNGLSAFAGANHFLDAFTRLHNRRSDQRWLSVNWEAWNFDGRSVKRSGIEATQFALEPSEGVDAFKRVLEINGAAQVVISSANLVARIEQCSSRAKRERDKSEGAARRSQHRRPALNSNYQEAADELEGQVVEILESLLGIEPIGINDDFFELGGHSLLATQVVSRVRSKFGVEVALRSLFENPTTRGIAAVIRATLTVEVATPERELAPVPREGDLPLSFAQQRLWFTHQLEPESSAYNIPVAARLQGTLAIAALRESLGEIARRHEVLRTRFELREGRPVQVIDGPGDVEVPVWDLSDQPEDEQAATAREIVSREGQRSFDLERGPVWKASLVRLGAKDHVLLICVHHVASDGWSMGVLVKEFAAIYEAYAQGRRVDLPALPLQYADFAVWQREWLQGGVLERQMEYWRRQLAGAPVLDLPTDWPRAALTGRRGGTVSLKLSDELTRQLTTLSRQEGVTLFITLLTGFQVVLGRYAGQDDVVVGTDVANRTRLETEGLIGFFVNQLILRTDLSANPSFREMLQRTRQTVMDAYEHQDVPFEKIVDELAPVREANRSPFFMVKLVLQNAPRADVGISSSLTVRGFDAGDPTSKFDLLLNVVETADGLVGRAQYDSDLFRESTIRSLLHFYHATLSAVARQDGFLDASKTDLLREIDEQAWRLLADTPNFVVAHTERPRDIGGPTP